MLMNAYSKSETPKNSNVFSGSVHLLFHFPFQYNIDILFGELHFCLEVLAPFLFSYLDQYLGISTFVSSATTHTVEPAKLFVFFFFIPSSEPLNVNSFLFSEFFFLFFLQGTLGVIDFSRFSILASINSFIDRWYPMLKIDRRKTLFL